MLKIDPQKCLENFLNGNYLERNYQFLLPVYEHLFRDIGRKIKITRDLKSNAKILKNYFSYLTKTKKENKISFRNKALSKKEITEKFINKLDKEEVKKAIDALEKIIAFLCKNRTNINGLEIVSWSLFGKTALEDITHAFVNNEDRKINIENAILGFDFNSLVIEYNKFTNVIVSDLLMPVELINPKRRQGLFDKEVFKLISIELKKIIKDFQFETELGQQNEDLWRNETNWLITEKITKRIKFPLPDNAKKIDMLCKIEDSLFVGTHKEQQAGGGAQDNQAVDASFLFNYTDEKLRGLRKIFGVKEIYLCIFLERGRTKLTSSHWKRIIDIVSDKSNGNKYLLSSVQFINLIKETYELR